MKRVLRGSSLAAILLAGLFVGGCANRSSDNASWLDELRASRVLQNAARAVLTGQIYDRAAIAIRDNNEAALESAQRDLQFVAPRLAAEQMVAQAVDLDSRAFTEKDKTRAAKLRAQAGEKYRAALAIDPNFDSKNPETLNALGYFLAERGTSTPDFQTAEKLTRRALEIWDELVEAASGTVIPGTDQVLQVRRFLRANTRDSLAWALFRQGEYSQALKEQKASLEEAESAGAKIGQKVSADLYYHLGEIYRALKNSGAARTQFQKALELEPDHELSQRALKALPALPKEPIRPSTEPELQPAPEQVIPGQPVPLTT
jgi:tetratricopeptide (TPR) repeat protein